jgi:phosphatidylinositol alpha-1,6-mannosyltransferase
LKIVYEKSDHIIVNSAYTKNLFRDFGIKQNMEIIFPGGDHLHFNSKNAMSSKVKIDLGLNDKFVLLTVGTLSERKDHETVLRAIKLLGNKTEKLHYLIVGTGPLEHHLKNVVDEFNIESQVSFYGYAKVDELPSLYDCCDLFILNSKIDRLGEVEGFGIVLIEANLMGKAVIGTKDCGMVDAVEDGKSGLLINMNDPEDTANAILKLYLNRELLRNMGKYGRDRALNDFTWQKSGEKTKQLLTKLIYKRNN